jgi:hypothetical protein
VRVIPSPVHTENSVHISCGMLIVDLVELATVTTIVLDLGDREPLRRTVDECFHAQGVRGAKEFGFGSTRVWLVRSMRSGIFAQEGKRRGNRLAPAKRRVTDIGGVIRRPEESLPRAPVPVVPLP